MINQNCCECKTIRLIKSGALLIVCDRVYLILMFRKFMLYRPDCMHIVLSICEKMVVVLMNLRIVKEIRKLVMILFG